MVCVPLLGVWWVDMVVPSTSTDMVHVRANLAFIDVVKVRLGVDKCIKEVVAEKMMKLVRHQLAPLINPFVFEALWLEGLVYLAQVFISNKDTNASKQSSFV